MPRAVSESVPARISFAATGAGRFSDVVADASVAERYATVMSAEILAAFTRFPAPSGQLQGWTRWIRAGAAVSQAASLP